MGRDRVAVLCGLLAAGVGALLLWFGPAGADTAAHVYQRWLFMHHGFVTWDNYWYSGRHVFVTYSWLYYPVAAVVGIKLSAALSLGVAAWAFARLVAWRPAALAFALVWGVYALSGAYPFMLGVAFGLCALLVRRSWTFAGLAALTWAASPLALVLLAVVVVGLRRWRAAAWVLALAAFHIVLAHLYHGRGHFPFRWQEWLAALGFAGGGALLARDRRLRGVFVAYFVFVLLAFSFQSQLGENAARLRFMALPLALLAVRGRPLWLAAPLVVLCTSYNLTPLLWSAEKTRDDPSHVPSYWTPALQWLHAHRDPNYRVHALDTAGHWEAMYLPANGIPITRGWYRQDDFPENAILYEDEISSASYVAWLRGRGVKYVVAAPGRLDHSSQLESVLVARLPRVAKTGNVTIYRVPRPSPLAPGARVLRLGHETVTLRVPRAGRYRLKIRGHETFDAPGAGVFTLDFS